MIKILTVQYKILSLKIVAISKFEISRRDSEKKGF